MKIIWPLVGMLIPLSLLALPFAFWLIKRSALKQKPLIDGDALEFALTPGMRFLLGSVLVGLTAFSVLVFVYGIVKGEGWYGVFIPLAVLVTLLMAKPRTVVVDQDGIRQRRWPLTDRLTAWTDIATVSRGDNTGRTFVWSTDGKIVAVFSPQLVGERRFEHEVRTRAKNAVFEFD